MWTYFPKASAMFSKSYGEDPQPLSLTNGIVKAPNITVTEQVRGLHGSKRQREVELNKV